MKKITLLLIVMLTTVALSAKDKTVKLHFVETTDVHGCLFPYDFISRKDRDGSMARVYQHVVELRGKQGRNVILLENGDLLQGQPAVYYSNYIATERQNIGAEVVNFMGYDAQAFGNHDVETGHAVYDKWVKETRCPVVGANIIDRKTGNYYVQPYTIIEREGVRVAVLGMLTPAIPNWLAESLWAGLEFKNMVESCREWVAYLKENEQPDVIVGLFHSGLNGGIQTPTYSENQTEQIAREVPGFDVIFYGHDHIAHCEQVRNAEGLTWVIDPANNAMRVGEAEIEVTIQEKGDGTHKLKSKRVNGFLTDISKKEVNKEFAARFAPYVEQVKRYVERPIAVCSETITTQDAYFGNCAFIDYIHQMQLALTGADISMNAPLAFNTQINEGVVYMSDMFSLYKYENNLCTVKMRGSEIRAYLEMSYSLWTNTMQSADDHLLLLRGGNGERTAFVNPSFNFDSAAGIDYEVDVTKPTGQKVRILQMSNGQPFSETGWYKVAMNSYRANGGGELLTRGAGIKASEIPSRVLYTSDKDLRFYLTQQIEKTHKMAPKAGKNWRFVPEEMVKPAAERDRKLIFGK